MRAELRRTWEKNTVWRCVVLARCCLSTCALRVSAQGFVDCAFWSRVCGYHAPRTTVGAYSKRRTISGVQRDCMVSTPAIQASQPSSPRALVHSQQVALVRARDLLGMLLRLRSNALLHRDATSKKSGCACSKSRWQHLRRPSRPGTSRHPPPRPAPLTSVPPSPPHHVLPQAGGSTDCACHRARGEDLRCIQCDVSCVSRVSI